jgi:RimJ/RimL family protein N-acetyltransferase
MMKKIQLVKHRMEYCEQIFKLSSAPPVKDALGLPDGTAEDTKQFIMKVMQEELSGNTISRVILDEKNNLIGLTDLMFINYENKSCHIGTWIGHEYWGLGYNEASKIAILRLAFEEIGLNFVFAGARSINIRSQKAQEKLPFIDLNVESLFPREHIALETKEKQSCVLNVFYKDKFITYINNSKEFNSI